VEADGGVHLGGLGAGEEPDEEPAPVGCLVVWGGGLVWFLRLGGCAVFTWYVHAVDMHGQAMRRSQCVALTGQSWMPLDSPGAAPTSRSPERQSSGQRGGPSSRLPPRPQNR